MLFLLFFFFFSSRRRHTRLQGDWSSDVCSSDLSPYAMSVFVALKVKEIDFELRTLDLSAGQNTGADYVAASLTARVPTLVDGDFSLSESSAICEYLQDRFGGAPLYPQDAQARARVRQD